MNVYRAGDVLPALNVTVEDTGLPIDVSMLNVYVRWERPDGSGIAERTLSKIDASKGRCAYVWQGGDLSVPGIYRGILQLAPTANPNTRQSLATPPELYVEVLPNDFEDRDDLFQALVPTPTSGAVALAMGQQLESLDPAMLIAAIDRARRLAYIQCHLFLIGSISPVQREMLKDLISQLAALLLTQPPSATYSPYRRETMASYSYELRELDTDKDLYGVPSIDALIKYFREHVQSVANPGIWVAYPEWWQPVTERLVDPSRLGTLDL